MSHNAANETVIDTVRPGSRSYPRNDSAAAAISRNWIDTLRWKALPAAVNTSARARRTPPCWEPHMGGERRPGRRQHQRAVPALEQCDAQRVLECLHLAREGRLRQEQFLRGGREREPPSPRLEAAQEVERG